MEKEWFKHEYHTRNKKKLAALLYEEKSRGYGLFWIIVEMLYESSAKAMQLDEATYISIVQQSGEPREYVEGFIERCLDRWKVFKRAKKNYFTTEKVEQNAKVRREISASRSMAGRKSAESRKYRSTSVQQNSTSVEQIPGFAEQTATEKRREEERREEESEREEGAPPTEIFKIEVCFSISLRDTRWVKASGATTETLAEFNRYLESIGEYMKNPLDYKRHYTNWVRKNGVPTTGKSIDESKGKNVW